MISIQDLCEEWCTSFRCFRYDGKIVVYDECHSHTSRITCSPVTSTIVSQSSLLLHP